MFWLEGDSTTQIFKINWFIFQWTAYSIVVYYSDLEHFISPGLRYSTWRFFSCFSSLATFCQLRCHCSGHLPDQSIAFSYFRFNYFINILRMKSNSCKKTNFINYNRKKAREKMI